MQTRGIPIVVPVLVVVGVCRSKEEKKRRGGGKSATTATVTTVVAVFAKLLGSRRRTLNGKGWRGMQGMALGGEGG